MNKQKKVKIKQANHPPLSKQSVKFVEQIFSSDINGAKESKSFKLNKFADDTDLCYKVDKLENQIYYKDLLKEYRSINNSSTQKENIAKSIKLIEMTPKKAKRSLHKDLRYSNITSKSYNVTDNNKLAGINSAASNLIDVNTVGILKNREMIEADNKRKTQDDKKGMELSATVDNKNMLNIQNATVDKLPLFDTIEEKLHTLDENNNKLIKISQGDNSMSGLNYVPDEKSNSLAKSWIKPQTSVPKLNLNQLSEENKRKKNKTSCCFGFFRF